MGYVLNLLQIVQTICDELGLNRPSVVVNSTDTQIRQIFALLNRSIRELQQNYDWTVLQSEYNLFVAQPTQSVGNVTQGAYTLTGIATQGFNADFNADFNGDFSSDTFTSSAPPPLLISNPSLWTVTGQGLPVNTRVLSVSLDSSTQLYTFTLDQPATSTETSVVFIFSQDTYPEPSDFSRFISQTWWDRTNRWALMGPDSPQVDQWHRSGIVTIGPRRHFRQIGSNGYTGDFNADFGNDFGIGQLNNYRIWPAPGATDTPLNLTYEYISANAVYSSSGTKRPVFTADTDIPILDYNMLILDTKWRLWQIKGFDFAPLQMEAIDYINRAYANDGGAKTLSLPSKRANMALTTGLTSDGSWPGPGNP